MPQVPASYYLGTWRSRLLPGSMYCIRSFGCLRHLPPRNKKSTQDAKKLCKNLKLAENGVMSYAKKSWFVFLLFWFLLIFGLVYRPMLLGSAMPSINQTAWPFWLVNFVWRVWVGRSVLKERSAWDTWLVLRFVWWQPFCLNKLGWCKCSLLFVRAISQI